MKPTVVIHTNDKQMLGALVSAHSYRRNSRSPSSFEVRIVNASEFPELQERGHSFVRGGHVRQWDPEDLQSFTPLRFAVPGLLGYEGLALVTDPDVFAVGDVAELFDRDLEGKAIWCRPRPGYDKVTDPLASSVMLLDCAKLRHWRFEDDLEALWAHRVDYLDWINLKREKLETIGILEPEWNDFDHLTSKTKLLHNTKRRTQPWKTGLPIDFTFKERKLLNFALPIVRKLAPNYTRHPDEKQEAFFYAMLADALDSGAVTKDDVEREVRLGHVRPDSEILIERYRGRLWPGSGEAPRAA
ncbi:MAG TPA: hypothetical protein VHE36_12830 [Sphingomicrobium sp.]|jgi:hypothetical protein|nr:hypothetical protein [Sphingomicrobium sp.]